MRNRSEVRGDRAEKPKKSKAKREQAEVVKIPIDPVNEVVVIAAMAVLLGRDPGRAKKIADRVPADAMHGSGHAEMWTGLVEMARRGLSYDPATLRQITGGAADADALDEYLAARPEPPPNLDHHVSVVLWDKARIELVRGPLAALHEALRDSSSEPAAVRALAKQVGHSLERYGERRFLLDPTRLIDEQRREVRAMREGGAFFKYGIDAIDFHTPGDTRRGPDGSDEDCAGLPRCAPGTAPGKITVLAATSGGGKSTFVRNCVLAMAKAGRRVCLGAWDELGGETLRELAALDLGWSRTDLYAGMFSEADERELLARMEELSSHVTFFALPFDRRPGERNFNDKNLDLIQEHVEASGAEVFFADLFHRALAQTRPDEVAAALQRQQAMAQEMRKHVVLVHQINAQRLQESGLAMPTKEFIKGGGAWHEIADILWMLDRVALNKDVTDDKIVAYLLKCRKARVPQAVELGWDGEFGTIFGGKSIPYQFGRGEDDDQDGLLSGSFSPPKGFRRGKGRGR